MVFAAYLEQSPDGRGRPRDARRKLRLVATGAKPGGQAVEVLVLNISTTGMLIESDDALTQGEALDIDLPHAGWATATVVWTSGRMKGCAFDKPISAAALSAAQLRGEAARSGDQAAPSSLAVESFGARLQRLRTRSGLTQADLAAALAVSEPAICAWERGKSRPRPGRIQALCELLGVSQSELLGQDSDEMLTDLLARVRNHIARAVGVSADKVRIMIEM